MPTLPVTIDATYGDDPSRPGTKEHQQAHDVLHALNNSAGQPNGLATLDETGTLTAGQTGRTVVRVRAESPAALNADIAASGTTGHRTFAFSGGFYDFTDTIQVNVKGVRFIGDRHGRRDVYGGTELRANFSGRPLIQLGTDDGLAYDRSGYDGAGEGFAMENIGLKANAGFVPLDNAQGLGYSPGTDGIKDWRGGSVLLKNVWMQFFDHAFWGIQSDFNAFENVDMWYCRTGIYAGPRSDQFTVERLLGKYCDRVIDVDGAWQFRLNNSNIVDSGGPTINPVRIRSQWPRASVGTSLDKVWFEQLVSSVNIDSFIEVGIGDAVKSTDIDINEPIVLTNDQVTTPHASFFIKTDNVDRISVHYPRGPNLSNLTRFARNVGTFSPGMVVDSLNTLTLRVQNDSTGVLDFTQASMASSIPRFDRETNGVPVFRVGKRGESFAQWSFLSTGRIDAGNGASAADSFISRGGVGFFAVPQLVKAGVPADSDYAAAPPNGTFAFNSSGAAGARVYVRIAGVWTAVA